VEPDSPADQCGLRPGQSLRAINGHAIGDVLDYRFYIVEEKLRLSMADEAGKPFTVTMHKDEYEDPGLLFDTYLMDREKSCKNNCCFCFVDQLPPGMRPSLYFKDDDSRLGFFFGNYITLTNLSETDIDRIIAMHISPVNISIHAMDPALRTRMMKNPRSGDVLAYLPKLSRAGIRINAQLVLCPGLNDGAALDHSLTALAELGDAIQSVSAVPVGLTKYREGLAPLRLFTKKEAADVVAVIRRHGDLMLAAGRGRCFFASDEFYLTAGLPIPAYAHYEEFHQLENGVGMSAMLLHEFTQALADAPDLPVTRHITIATGAAARPLMENLARMAMARYKTLRADVACIPNDFFGRTITVAGLVTGRDIIAHLQGRALGDALLFPASMLRHDGDLFLDDRTPDDLEKALGLPCIPVAVDGYALVDALLGVYSERLSKPLRF
jgi:putative radical SAM enzyme (TIGR03279 family)